MNNKQTMVLRAKTIENRKNQSKPPSQLLTY
jgi:hypothetical protein